MERPRIERREQKLSEQRAEERVPTLQLSIPKEGGGYQNVDVRIKHRLTLFLPKGSHIEMKGRLVDHVRVPIDERRSIYINFGTSKKVGFYASLKLYERKVG
jgi:hypothetical protein